MSLKESSFRGGQSVPGRLGMRRGPKIEPCVPQYWKKFWTWGWKKPSVVWKLLRGALAEGLGNVRSLAHFTSEETTLQGSVN